MITLKELNPKNFPVTKEQSENSLILLAKINLVRTKWGKPMIVTSGFRSLEDHLRIYRELAEKHNKEFDESKVPMGSQHLKFAAVDISDPDGLVKKWLKENPEVLENAQLWCEDDTSGWVHFQIFAPSSANRWFKV